MQKFYTEVLHGSFLRNFTYKFYMEQSDILHGYLHGSLHSNFTRKFIQKFYIEVSQEFYIFVYAQVLHRSYCPWVLLRCSRHQGLEWSSRKRQKVPILKSKLRKNLQVARCILAYIIEVLWWRLRFKRWRQKLYVEVFESLVMSQFELLYGSVV